MEEIQECQLFQPLLPTPTTTINQNEEPVSDSRILHRFILVFYISIISIWANYQASQGFEIIVINDIKDTPAGRKFHLFFVSNDKATRIVLHASKLAEKILCPHDRQTKKPVNRVTIRFTDKNLTRQEEILKKSNEHEYTLHLNSSIMEEDNVEKAMLLAVQRGMSRIWLWNGEGAPEVVTEGLVEYVNLVGGVVQSPEYRLGKLQAVENSCWRDWNHMEMVKFLRYCEMMNKGFIGRSHGRSLA
ncbi:hypothetical protein ACHQM5_004603 [Ranunculus cassubicifolius]